MKVLLVALVLFLFIPVRDALCNQGTKNATYILIVNDMVPQQKEAVMKLLDNFLGTTLQIGDKVVLVSGATSEMLKTYSVEDDFPESEGSKLRIKRAHEKGLNDSIIRIKPQQESAVSLYGLTSQINWCAPGCDSQDRDVFIYFINMTSLLMRAGAQDFSSSHSNHFIKPDNEFALCCAHISVFESKGGQTQPEEEKNRKFWRDYAAVLRAGEPSFHNTAALSGGQASYGHEISKSRCSEVSKPHSPPNLAQSDDAMSRVELVWDNPACDLDLHAIRNGEDLYYKTHQTSYGEHFGWKGNGKETLWLKGNIKDFEIQVLHVNGPPPNNAKLIFKNSKDEIVKCVSVPLSKGYARWIALGFSWTPTWTYGADVLEVSDGQRIDSSEAVLGQAQGTGRSQASSRGGS